jgi:hypothetical protein
MHSGALLHLLAGIPHNPMKASWIRTIAAGTWASSSPSFAPTGATSLVCHDMDRIRCRIAVA